MKTNRFKNITPDVSGKSTRIRVQALLLVLSALLFFSAPQCALAKVELHPEAQLLSLSRKSVYGDATKLLETGEYDTWLLGRALCEAVKHGDGNDAERISYVRALIRSGADLSYNDATGADALIYSAKQGDSELVKALLESGAVNGPKDKRGHDALFYASSLHGEAAEVTALFGGKIVPVIPPKIENVELELVDGIVHITFDLVATDKACVSLEGSLDGGDNFGMSFEHSTGDLGKEVAPGKRKKILWKAQSDYPEGLDDYDVVLDVIAINCG